MDQGLSRASSCSKLPHSHSTPAGVADGGGSRTPPAAPATPKKGGKMLVIRVHMLDDSITLFQVQAKAVGRVLFEQVCKQLHLLEADYFGLEYQDSANTRYWLDLEKPVARQVGLSLVDPLLSFCVKFYTPDPAQLEEEFTRYLFCLQVKRDLALGLVQCNENTAALMASYIVQAESGDYVAEDYPDSSYLATNKFVPHQDRELERRIMENHKKHAGQSPAEADLNLLETARRCELYGIKMHPAKDHEGVPLNLSVAHMGIVIFQNYTKINTFSWAKIRKISFKRKRFLIKLHPEGYGFYKDTVEFFFEGRNECKNFWKKCVENHGFFRCSAVKRVPRQRTRVLSRGSSFRYSGKTQKQMVEFVRENYVKRQTFQRSQSFRHSSSVHSSVATNVGGSISAHPLLPLGDSSVVSLSCGSMSLAGVGGAVGASPSPIARPRPPTGRPTTTAIVAPTTIDTSATFTTDSPEPDKGSPTVMVNGHGGVVGDEKEEMVDGGEERERENNNVVVSSTPTHKLNGTINYHNEVKVVVSPSPDLSPLKSINISIKDELIRGSGDSVDGGCGEIKKKRNTSDRAYFIAKEILMTERTYRKDLEVINLWLREELCKDEQLSGGGGGGAVDALLSLVDPLHDAHCLVLRDVELRLASWDTTSTSATRQQHQTQQKIADVLLKACDYLPLYENYMDRHLDVLEQLDEEFRTNPKFEQAYRDFETHKICYLPLTAFVLKPLHRLFHYTQLLERLLKHYPKNHADFEDCQSARDRLRELQPTLADRLRQSENFVALCELQRDTVGFDLLSASHHHHRQFIRQGCLNKFSTRKGYLQRMFFLLSDVLLYTNRVGQLFSVHGRLPLHSLSIEERCDTPTANSFIIYGGNRVLTLAASSEEEKDKWLEDLTEAIDLSKTLLPPDHDHDNNISSLSLKSCGSLDDVMDRCGVGEVGEGGGGGTKVSPQRSNTPVHVCWHRNTSLGVHDVLRAAHNTLSGYLLRKFKNSNGWQKLWVVFTNFCLFFYKTYQDDCPLASLPLLGYTVSTPNENDSIHKDFVFKLQFKNHVYFFRAESEYTFNRWMEVISSATQHAGRMRLFSRKDSALED